MIGGRSRFFNREEKYEWRHHVRHLRMLLNRSDIFPDITKQTHPSARVHNQDPNDPDGAWVFLVQIVLAKELGRRLATGEGWTSTDFTHRLLAMLILADQWIDNVKIGLYDPKREGLKKDQEKNGKPSRPHNAAAEALKTKGNAALATNNLDEALGLYTQALEISPSHPVYLTNRAAAQFRLKRYAGTIQDAVAAVEVDPLYSKSWSWLGAAKLETGDHRGSVVAYEWALDVDPAGGTQTMKEGLAKARYKVAEAKHPDLAKLSPARRERALEDERWNLGQRDTRFNSLCHHEQAHGLIRFAELMKWPFLDELRTHVNALYDKGFPAGTNLHVWEWFYGLSLPGKYFSSKIGATLVLCTPSLAMMKASTYFDAGISLPEASYWRTRTPLGRVLGSIPGVKSLCGWIGPLPPVDGPKKIFIRLRAARVTPKRKKGNTWEVGGYKRGWNEHTVRPQPEEDLEVWAEEIQDISKWLIPKPPVDDLDAYEIRKIGLEELPFDRPREGLSQSELEMHTAYAASIEFRFSNGCTKVYQLKSNSVFVTLPTCYNNGKQHAVHTREFPPYSRNIFNVKDLVSGSYDYERDGVMVINATGKGAETLARAWCAENGHNAGIRQAGGPCYTCAYNTVSHKGLYLEILIWCSSAGITDDQCRVCQELCTTPANTDLDIPGIYSYQKNVKTTLEDVTRSVERGCPSCSIILGAIVHSDITIGLEMPPLPVAHLDGRLLSQRRGYSIPESSHHPLDARFSSSDSVINGTAIKGSGLCITAVYRKSKEDIHGTAVEIEVYREKGIVIALVRSNTAPLMRIDNEAKPGLVLPLSSSISGNTESDQSFTRALTWIENCVANHRRCDISASALPDRVIDIGLSRKPDDTISPVRLIEIKDSTTSTTKYACLSYCWGSANHLVTLTSTLGNHKTGIPWAALPRTFQDAINFIARLDIRYLWIDSLCILQDNKNDWSIQSYKMPSIYENAHITLAATASSNSMGGLYSHASPEYISRTFNIEDRFGTTHKILARRHLPHWLMGGGSATDLQEQGHGLLRRAWVFQERLLSPRVLHFSRHELMWECMEEAACECSFLDHIERRKTIKTAHNEAISLNGEVRRDLGIRWRDLVGRYSGLNMTYQKDKLQALSGVARQMNRSMQDAYIAGLWLSTIIEDMLWEASSQRARPSPWRAPSWSWASVTAPIHYVSELSGSIPNVTPWAKVLSATTRQAAQDEMGELSSASLEIHSEFTMVYLAIFTPDPTMVVPTAPSLIVDGKTWIPPSGSNQEYSFISTKLAIDIILPPSTPMARRPPYGEKIGTQAFFAMRLARVGNFEYSLLLACVDHPKGKYERVGICGEYVSGDAALRMPWGDASKTFFTTMTLV